MGNKWINWHLMFIKSVHNSCFFPLPFQPSGTQSGAAGWEGRGNTAAHCGWWSEYPHPEEDICISSLWWAERCDIAAHCGEPRDVILQLTMVGDHNSLTLETRDTVVSRQGIEKQLTMISVQNISDKVGRNCSSHWLAAQIQSPNFQTTAYICAPSLFLRRGHPTLVSYWGLPARPSICRTSSADSSTHFPLSGL